MAAYNRRIWRVKPPPGTALLDNIMAPNLLCLPMNEYGGLQLWDYSTSRDFGGNAGRSATISGTTVGRAINRDGVYWSHQSTDARVSFNTSGSGAGILSMPLVGCTVLVGRKKRDSTNRASTLFGM